MAKLLGGVMFVVILLSGSAGAQVSREAYAPLTCYEIVDGLEIASTTAIEVCAGSNNDAPGRCMATALETGELTTQQMVELCRGATSLEPNQCYADLDAEGTLTNDEMIRYCGSRCPMGPAPPQSGNAACMAAALEATDLPEQTSAQLCLAASSAAPVDCYSAGEDATELALTDTQLVQLCAERTSCQYVNAVPVAGY